MNKLNNMNNMNNINILNKYISHITFVLLAGLLAGMTGACSSDDIDEKTDTPAAVRHTFSIPLAITEERTPVSRATGDPGIDPEPHAPSLVYIWADVTLSDPDGGNEEQAILFQNYNTTPDRWDYINDDPLHPDDRYVLTTQSRVVFDIGRQVLKTGTTVGIYAIATDQPLPLPSALQEDKVAATADIRQQLRTLTLDLSGWSAATPALHSAALGGLYSTPLPLKAAFSYTYPTAPTDVQRLNAEHCGIYVADDQGSINEQAAATRLYHCAAKVDFKWEVAAALQRTTAVSTITLSGLPTQLNVFTPTQNPVGTATCPLVAPTAAVHLTSPGNQWIGREYAYVLQPPTTAATTDGIITYGVTFSNPDGGSVRTAISGAKTGAATNTTFTTWYRVNAEIK